ncbi:MAG: arylsulfotransferase family protein [Myxococcota bacterium]
MSEGRAVRCAAATTLLPALRRSAAAATLWLALLGCGGEDPASEEAEAEEVELLAQLGYVSGSEKAPSESGVVRFDRSRASPGLNFYTSGHAGTAILMDMEGRAIHRWQTTFREVWPKRPMRKRYRDKEWFRRAHLFENGDVLGVWAGGGGLIRLDKDSNVVWSRGLWAHHDLEVLPDGRIVVLTSKGRRIPRIHPKNHVIEDFVTVVAASGEIERSVSLLEAFENSPRYQHVWLSRARDWGSLMHANTVEMLDGRLAERIPAFGAGRVLVSLRNLDAIAVVDLEQEQVVWAQQGKFVAQHDPTVLENGNILVFDNIHRPGVSRVEEYDPFTMREVWAYRGPARQPFYSDHSGAAQRLPNGNTLITETSKGRAFEVTPEKEIVWEFLSPHRAGEQGELIATLYEMIRLPEDFPIEWAQSPAP